MNQDARTHRASPLSLFYAFLSLFYSLQHSTSLFLYPFTISTPLSYSLCTSVFFSLFFFSSFLALYPLLYHYSSPLNIFLSPSISIYLSLSFSSLPLSTPLFTYIPFFLSIPIVLSLTLLSNFLSSPLCIPLSLYPTLSLSYITFSLTRPVSLKHALIQLILVYIYAHQPPKKFLNVNIIKLNPHPTVFEPTMERDSV